jgi:ribonucleoside-diphosphate reductase alpha chain
VSNGVKFNDVFGVSRFNCSKGVGFSVGMRVNSIEDAGTADVYDITVDCESHVYNLGFCITANCGEQWLPPYGNCNLGSVNLSACVDEGVMEDEALYQISKIAARALYVACQKNQLPLPAMMEENREHPRIGLGVVGLAEALIKVGVRYGSEESLVLAKKWLGVIRMAAMDELRHEKCEAFLSIAPTGSLSTIMGTSAGIEPYFAFITKRHIMDRDFIEIATCYEEAEDKSVCVTAHEVTPEEHVRMLAACQEIVDNSISKTVNMPETATKADVDEIYRLAWKLGCKGITIYREGSRDAPIESLKPEDVYTCPECGNKQIRDGAHCIQCSNCGFQQCG